MSFVVDPVRDTAWASYFISAVVTYYLALWVVSLLGRSPSPVNSYAPLVAILVPARNEARVIEETLTSLLSLDYEDHLVVVLNDGSTDDTGRISHELASADGRLIVVDRGEDVAGRGKSDVLNHGFAVIQRMLGSGDPRMQGRSPGDVLIGIVDADGRLDGDSLRIVAPYFAEARVGQLQIGVKIQNAKDSMLARMQDMEFVGFSSLVQVARDKIGSSGLGGNGQFTRMSALLTLGRPPWRSNALTEDLDLGLSLVERGWVTRFTNSTYVYQQGLTSWRPLLRQRTRWIQGHYQCWSHLPRLALARNVRWAARVDLLTYLLLVVTVSVVAFSLVAALCSELGVLRTSNDFLGWITPGLLRESLSAVFTTGPIVAFLVTYQRFSDQPLAWWEIPAFGFLFTLYSYVWAFVTIRAWLRIACRRSNWVKTPRVLTTS